MKKDTPTLGKVIEIDEAHSGSPERAAIRYFEGLGHRASEDLVCRQAEDPLGGRIEVADPEIAVEQDHPLAEGGRDGAEAGQIEIGQDAGVAGGGFRHGLTS